MHQLSTTTVYTKPKDKYCSSRYKNLLKPEFKQKHRAEYFSKKISLNPRISVTPMQTLVVEEQLLPLHPLPLRRAEAQNSFEL